MNIVDHQQRISGSMKGQKSKGKRKSTTGSLKVVYISSPMKVKTSASKFRSLVQQLTGKNSDVSRYMDENNHVINDFHEIDCGDDDHDGLSSKEEAISDQQHQVFSSISSEDTQTSSDTFFGSMDNMFSSQMLEEQLAGIFSSSSFCEMDVLGSYDELL